MIRLARAGFSLVEIVIGVGLVALLSILFLKGIHSTKKQSEFTAEYFTSFFLAQKVMEDLATENKENPQAFSTLGIEGGSTEGRVVNGELVFFSHLGNRLPPFDRMEPAKDGTIDTKKQPLFSQVEKFRLKVESKREAPPSAIADENSNLVKASVNLEWDAKTGQGSYESACLFFSPVTQDAHDTQVSADPAEIEKEFCRFFFNAPEKPMFQVANEVNGEPEFFRRFGRVHFLTANFLKSSQLTQALSDIRFLEAGIKAPQISAADLWDKRWKLGKTWHEVGQISFLILRETEADLRWCQSKWEPSVMGSGFFANQAALWRPLTNFKRVKEIFNISLVEATRAWQGLLKPELVARKGIRWQYEILDRIGDLYRIMAVHPDFPEGTKNYKAHLKSLQDMTRDRDPARFRLVTRELQAAGIRKSMEDLFPNLRPITAVCCDSIPGVTSFIDSTVDVSLLAAAIPDLIYR